MALPNQVSRMTEILVKPRLFVAEPDPRDGVQRQVIELIANIVLFNHAVAQQLGLGASDSQFMTLLEVNGPMAPSELAAATGLTSGTVTGVLDRLERAELIAREPDPTDRRKVVIRPDESRISSHVRPLYEAQGAHLAAVLAQRSDQEVAVIASFLTDVLDGPGVPGPPGSATG